MGFKRGKREKVRENLDLKKLLFLIWRLEKRRTIKCETRKVNQINLESNTYIVLEPSVNLTQVSIYEC